MASIKRRFLLSKSYNTGSDPGPEIKEEPVIAHTKHVTPTPPSTNLDVVWARTSVVTDKFDGAPKALEFFFLLKKISPNHEWPRKNFSLRCSYNIWPYFYLFCV